MAWRPHSAVDAARAPIHRVRFGAGRKIMVRTFVALAAIAASFALAACNTVRGAGQDIESAANTVDDAT